MAKIKRGSIAFLLSFLVPGLGQIYNGQMFAGVAIAAAFLSLICVARVSGLILAFRTMAAYVVLLWSFQLVVPIHAAVVGVRRVTKSKVPIRSRLPYAGLALLMGVIAVSILAFPDRFFGVRAFLAQAESMSPTLVPGDRFVVDMRYYNTHRPTEGDVVAFIVPNENSINVKRIIAVGGDSIKGGPDGITVNGQLLREPYVSHNSKEPGGNDSGFGPVYVPPNKLFVMGDNRENSYDSRHFGSVDVNRVIGKALFVYMSFRDNTRIGRTIR